MDERGWREDPHPPSGTNRKRTLVSSSGSAVFPVLVEHYDDSKYHISSSNAIDDDDDDGNDDYQVAGSHPAGRPQLPELEFGNPGSFRLCDETMSSRTHFLYPGFTARDIVSEAAMYFVPVFPNSSQLLPGFCTFFHEGTTVN
ncbi:hypothetical protein ZHAS_00010890 [Anopheles sinensis]|uniref:Uncharacterized protein n=1 Tax=Anopheles sinensis TaxID=74873 RepID=A0A084VYS7_ANOSI|nr:hypothetical protein ZHAS_00010890 [Anopheles sinensis]